MHKIKDSYKHVAAKLIANSIQPDKINTNNILQYANKTNREILNKEIIKDLIQSGSDILNFSGFEKLNDLACDGKACLIVMEHYSNFDLPNLIYLLENKKKRLDIAENIVAMAGMKLNTESDFVRAFTEAYTRIVIYPSRSLVPFMGSDAFPEELFQSQRINRAALHEMIRQKHSGKMILFFPSGTRYRKGHPETQRGLIEVGSYIKSFDYFLPIAISGNTLRINPIGVDMSEDYIHKDCIIIYPGSITPAKKWHAEARSQAPEDQNPRQYVADCIMRILGDLHNQADRMRIEVLKPTIL